MRSQVNISWLLSWVPLFHHCKDFHLKEHDSMTQSRLWRLPFCCPHWTLLYFSHFQIHKLNFQMSEILPLTLMSILLCFTTPSNVNIISSRMLWIQIPKLFCTETVVYTQHAQNTSQFVRLVCKKINSTLLNYKQKTV